ncbi:hypothetical protein P3T76_008232 [Phytophthora citrophthora]|uniref:M96 mating-specific protein family n=1 Tax=Phytophthora citrophthora TaxID=4793 RepID=A0AAD9LLY2_9STRA|nr:hypothetical protein P3T76_008232 [Phytophthora citrophthora]
MEEAEAILTSFQVGCDEYLLDLPDIFGDWDDQEPEEMAEPPRRRGRTKRNKAREQRSAELQRLRHEVEDLEFTLKRLQTIRGRVESKCSSKHGFRKDSVWKEACHRQLERRLRVERENMHLMKNLEREKQLVKRLKNLLDMRPALWNMVYPEARKLSRRIDIPPGGMKHMADLIFQELASGVEIVYRNVEKMDEAIRPLLEKLPMGEPLLREINGRRAEAFGCNIVPFGMDETGNAWWQYWNNYRGQMNEDNVVTETFGFEITDRKANVTATFYQQQILRRHIEGDRVVIVWDGYMEPFLFKGERIRDVYYREASYVLITPKMRGGEICTTVSTCETMMPHFLDPKLSKDPTVEALTEFIVSSMPSDILTSNEIVENLLLDQALRHRHDS